MSNSILEIIDEATMQFEEALRNLPYVNAAKCNLDNQCGSVYVDVDNQLIIARGESCKRLEYYGGFEYIDDDAKAKFGEYTIYMSDDGDDRVGEAVSYYEQMHGDN